MQLSSDAIHVHDALSGVVVAKDLGIVLAQALCFFFRKRIAQDKCIYLLKQVVVRFFVLLGLCQVRA